MGNVISLAAVRASLAERAEERATNLAHCIEIAQPVVKALNCGSYTAPPPAAPAAPAPPPTVAPKLARAPATPQPLHWRESQAGNWWTKDVRNGIHFVIFQNRRGWGGRVTMPSGEGWFENMPGVCSAEEARAWAEEWIGARRVRSVAAAQERTIP